MKRRSIIIEEYLDLQARACLEPAKVLSSSKLPGNGTS
jgi:hypothetical protein